MSLQPVLLRAQVDGFSPVDLDVANELVMRWDHDLGPCERPFGSDCWTFDVDNEPVAVAIAASTVSEKVTGTLVPVAYERGEIVELARLCSVNRWANRLMLRWWREVGAKRWPYWPVKAAVSYSDRGKTGDLYRFDGWTLIADNCGSGRGGSWSTKRVDGGKGKKLWLWRYD